jgi:hypothetical protein
LKYELSNNQGVIKIQRNFAVIGLFSDVSPSQRLARLGHEGEPVLLSKHYCIGFVDESSKQHMPIKLTLTDGLHISDR